MTLIEIRNWLKNRIAAKYGIETTEVEPLITSPEDIKWVASELVDTTVKYIHGKVPIVNWDITGTFYNYSYGIIRKRDTDEYYPDGQHSNIKPLLDYPFSPETEIENQIDDYLQTQNIWLLPNSIIIINKTEPRVTVKCIHQGRNLSTLGFGTCSLEDYYHVWKDGSDVWHNEKIKNVKITVSPSSM